jgi:glycosyltransferase involved in cell wall biosynthesis
MPDASVIVCAYADDRWGNLVAAVDSLRRQTVAPAEIILVIDHNDRLLERATSLQGVVTISNSGAQGASGSRNSGVATASGAVVAFLDDDAIADPDWLALLLRAYAEPSVAGVGGSIAPEWPGQRPPWFPEEFDWVVGCTYRGMPGTKGPVRSLIGANMSVRREVLERVGGFREGFGNVKSAVSASWAGETRASSCEDTELCIRVSQVYPDLLWIYEPRARVRHHVPRHRCTWRYYLSRSREEGLAKAILVSTVGRESALETERSYAGQTLPAGIARGLHEAIVGRDIDGLRRAGAIVAGLSMTVAGFVEGRMRTPGRSSESSP